MGPVNLVMVPFLSTGPNLSKEAKFSVNGTKFSGNEPFFVIGAISSLNEPSILLNRPI